MTALRITPEDHARWQREAGLVRVHFVDEPEGCQTCGHPFDDHDLGETETGAEVYRCPIDTKEER